MHRGADVVMVRGVSKSSGGEERYLTRPGNTLESISSAFCGCGHHIGNITHRHTGDPLAQATSGTLDTKKKNQTKVCLKLVNQICCEQARNKQQQ
jgi:hypothetical protein